MKEHTDVKQAERISVELKPVESKYSKDLVRAVVKLNPQANMATIVHKMGITEDGELVVMTL